MNSRTLTALVVIGLLGWLVIQYPASAGHWVHTAGTFLAGSAAGLSKFVHSI